MGLKSYFIDFLGKIFDRETGLQIDIDYKEVSANIAAKELALTSAIAMIGNAIALSKFETYQNGEATNAEDFYLLNVRPNQNESAARFWQKAVMHLFLKNECLIIKQNSQLYIADSFSKKPYAFYNNIYSNIIVNDYRLDAQYNESDVIYLKNNDKNIANFIASLYQDYGKLIEYSKVSYKRNNAKRGVLTIPSSYPQTEKAQEDLQKLLNERVKDFYTSETGAVLPLTSGITYEELSKDSYKNATDSRDIKNLIDDVYDFTARAFQIPPQLLKGAGTELTEQIKTFVNLCIDPLAQKIEDELNAKLYTKKQYMKNTYVRVNTNKVKASSLSDVANAIDILTRNGVHSIDENRELVGKEPLRTAESQKHFITKNYDKSEDK